MSTSSPTGIPSSSTINQVESLEALKSVRAEMDALADADLRKINVELADAAIMVLGRIPSLRALRSEIASLPGMDMARFDRIETYTLAAAQAHAQYLAASALPGPTAAIAEQLTQIREVLVSDVRALATRKLLDGTRLGELEGPSGYRNIAVDVLLLCAMLRDNWSTIQGKTGVTPEEIANAQHLANQLARALAEKQNASAAETKASNDRQRAFTLFFTAYDQARRAVSFLRWDRGDADEIAPSLLAGRKKSKKQEESELDVDDTAPIAAPKPPAPNANTAPAPAAPPVSSGMPGENPIIGR